MVEIQIVVSGYLDVTARQTSVSSMFSITFKPCHSSAIEPIQTIFGNVVDTSQGCISTNFGQNLHTGNRDIRRQTFNVNLVPTQLRLALLHPLSDWITVPSMSVSVGR